MKDSDVSAIQALLFLIASELADDGVTEFVFGAVACLLFIVAIMERFRERRGS